MDPQLHYTDPSPIHHHRIRNSLKGGSIKHHATSRFCILANQGIVLETIEPKLVMHVSPVFLEGRYVRLEPLVLAHAPGLFAIGRDPAIWEYLSLAPFARLIDAQRYIADASERTLPYGNELPFAVIERATGDIAGTTRYLDIRPLDRAIEIGWTWYGLPYQRSAINTETKLLLLAHAFDSLKAVRVQLKTDSRNLRSQRAIERLGAIQEGVLRKHMILPKDGYIRDSMYFSIIEAEWPPVRTRLERFLAGNVS